MVDRVSYGPGISGLVASVASVGVTPILIEPGPLEARAEPPRSQLSRLEAQSPAGVLLDEVVRVVDGDDWREADVLVTDTEVQVASPALFGMKEPVRLQRDEVQPGGQLLLAGLVLEPDAADLAAAPDPARDVVAGELALQALLKPIGVAGIEALADERLQIVAERLRQLVVGQTRDASLLDDVARVDVVVAIGRVAAPHDEEHAGLAAGIHGGSHRGHVIRSLGFEAGGEYDEGRLLQRCLGEAADRVAKTGTQAIDIEPGDLRRGDDRPFRDDRLLIGRGLRRGGQQREEQSKCAHALGESKE